MSNKAIDILCALLFLLTGAFLFWQSLGIVPMMDTRDLGSGFMPKVVGISLMAVSLIKLVVAFISKDNYVTQKSDADTFGGLMTIGALLFYVAAFEFVGFILATILYLFVQMLILSDSTNRNLKLFAAISVGTALAVYGLFVYVFDKPLPTGLLSGLGI